MPSWILENVNNSELARELFAQNLVGRCIMALAQMTHDQNSKQELFLCDVIFIMYKDVYIKQMSGT